MLRIYKINTKVHCKNTHITYKVVKMCEYVFLFSFTSAIIETKEM